MSGRRVAAAGLSGVLPGGKGRGDHVVAGSARGACGSDIAEHAGAVVVEHNREIVRDRTRLDSMVLATGDSVEIVHFVGGG